MFSESEIIQYSRHFILPSVGQGGQQKLKKSKVLCVGAGGLGVPVLSYLVAAGVGTIGIIDGDVVELSNLQRQVLYAQQDIGKPKAECAKNRLNQLNKNINIVAYSERLTKKNALQLIMSYDIIVDGTDNFSSRYLINDACYTLNKPMVYGSIFQFEGQCSVFLRNKGPCYRCLFPNIPEGYVPNCSEAGVLSVLPGIIGCIQANEVIKLILETGKPLVGKLLCLDSLSMDTTKFDIASSKQCVLCSGKKEFAEMVYEGDYFCQAYNIPVIDLQELRDIQARSEPLVLLDIRDYIEHEVFSLGGICIPLNELKQRIHELDKKKKIIVYCSIGALSKTAAALLKDAGFEQVFSLKDGVLEIKMISD